MHQRREGQTRDLEEHNAKECESIAGKFPSASPASEAIHFGKVPASEVSCGLSKLLAPQGHQKRAHSWVRVHTEPDPGSVHHAQPVLEADVALNACVTICELDDGNAGLEDRVDSGAGWQLPKKFGCGANLLLLANWLFFTSLIYMLSTFGLVWSKIKVDI